MEETLPDDDVQLAKKLVDTYLALANELGKVIVGQHEVVEEMLIAIFCNAHCLMVGVPGLAKTLLVSTLAQTLSLSFKRIQFTPDLMPADITGTDIIQEDDKTGRRFFEFQRGPIFANVILADEINRTPPKTQAALLEAMQERHVTIGDHTYDLDQPFFVLATQNPLEQEGTYPLPEAQLDRFMFMINVDYPGRDEEIEIMKRTTMKQQVSIEHILGGAEILSLQDLVRKVPVGDHVFDYAVNLVRATRPRDETAPDFIKEYLSWGAGPRACQNLILAAKARAILKGRVYATMNDIDSLARPVLRHRLGTNFNADSEGITVEDLLDRLTAHNQTKRPVTKAAG
ncbi:MAG: MoxR family ATPase [Planctomycetota bacterium]|nr:MoxR family ATPase [Planctomycetota bacterium]MDA1139614.1 MoxR family ATPase [Planctomycetota bacterium]